MLTDDQILEMAKQSGIEFDADGSNSFIFSQDQFIAFARLIQQAQREEDAQIVLSRCIGYAVDDYDLNTLAAAIRNSGDAA